MQPAYSRIWSCLGDATFPGIVASPGLFPRKVMPNLASPEIRPKVHKNARNIPCKAVRRTRARGYVLYFTEQGTCTASSAQTRSIRCFVLPLGDTPKPPFKDEYRVKIVLTKRFC